MWRAPMYTKRNTSKEKFVDKKCIMCGKALKEYRPMYYSYNFFQWQFQKTIKLTASYFSKIYPINWKGNNYRIIAKKKIRRNIIPKFNTKNVPTYYFCNMCGQIYSDYTFNFRNLSLRKRII